MPVLVLDLQSTDDARDIVQRAVGALAAGQVIAIPTETVYGLAALATDAAAVRRLLAAKRRPVDSPFAIAVQDENDAFRYAPQMPPVGRRLARRCWPGPVTLIVEHGPLERGPLERGPLEKGPLERSRVGQFPEPVRQVVAPRGTIGLRVAAHSAVADILHDSDSPLVLTSANRSGQPDATAADQVIDTFGEEIDLVLDDGPCHYRQPSTVVRVGDCGVEILREGVVAKTTIERLSTFMVLLVCTGNTCRSPMAEVLMRKHLAKRLGCGIDDIEQHGAIVVSAGIAAGMGGRSSPHAIEVAAEMGLSLNGHLSQPVTETLVRHADMILTMTRGHREAIVGYWPDAAERTLLLRRDKQNIADPIGGTLDMYRDCVQQMDRELNERANQLAL